MYELDADTALTPIGDGRFAGRLTDRWSIGPVPNGGYVVAFGLAAAQRVVERPDPITTSAHFLRPARPGAAEVSVTVMKRGKRFVSAEARIAQDGIECVRLLTAFGDIERAEGPRYVAGAPPVVPPRDAPASPATVSVLPEIAKRFETRFAPETIGWTRGEPSGTAELRGRVRFADGRPADTLSLPLFADAFPPPVFNVIAPGWVPSIELTVHVRARPASEWLLMVFRTRFVFGGLLEEDGEIWDEHGTLCALSRQIAAVPR